MASRKLESPTLSVPLKTEEALPQRGVSRGAKPGTPTPVLTAEQGWKSKRDVIDAALDETRPRSWSKGRHSEDRPMPSSRLAYASSADGGTSTSRPEAESRPGAVTWKPCASPSGTWSTDGESETEEVQALSEQQAHMEGRGGSHWNDPEEYMSAGTKPQRPGLKHQRSVVPRLALKTLREEISPPASTRSNVLEDPEIVNFEEPKQVHSSRAANRSTGAQQSNPAAFSSRKAAAHGLLPPPGLTKPSVPAGVGTLSGTSQPVPLTAAAGSPHSRPARARDAIASHADKAVEGLQGSTSGHGKCGTGRGEAVRRSTGGPAEGSTSLDEPAKNTSRPAKGSTGLVGAAQGRPDGPAKGGTGPEKRSARFDGECANVSLGQEERFLVSPQGSSTGRTMECAQPSIVQNADDAVGLGEKSVSNNGGSTQGNVKKPMELTAVHANGCAEGSVGEATVISVIHLDDSDEEEVHLEEDEVAPEGLGTQAASQRLQVRVEEPPGSLLRSTSCDPDTLEVNDVTARCQSLPGAELSEGAAKV